MLYIIRNIYTIIDAVTKTASTVDDDSCNVRFLKLTVNVQKYATYAYNVFVLLYYCCVRGLFTLWPT